MPACPVCSVDNTGGAKFCKACGSRLDQPPSTAPVAADQRECPQCHRSVAANAKFCRYCGTSFVAADTSSPLTSDREAPHETAPLESPSDQAAPPTSTIETASSSTPETLPAVASASDETESSEALVVTAEPTAPAVRADAPDLPEIPIAPPEPPEAPIAPPEPLQIPTAPPAMPATVTTIADRTVRPPSGAPPQSAPVLKPGLPPSRILALVASVALLLGGAGAAAWYLMTPRTASTAAATGPDQASLESRVSSILPAFVKLTGFQIESSESAGSAADQVVTSRFRGDLLFTADTFVPSAVEENAVIVTPRFKQGSMYQIAGVARSRRSGTTWDSEIAFAQDPTADLGTPRESFQAQRVIVAGSPEEAAFREEQNRDANAATQVAAAAPPPEPAAPAPQVQKPAVAPPSPAPRVEQPRPVSPPRQTTAPGQTAPTAQPPQTSQVTPPPTTAQPAQAPPPAESGAPPQTATNPPRPEPEKPPAAPAPPPAERTPAEPVVRTLEVPVGTEVEVRLVSGLNSGTSSVEDRFEAATVAPVNINGRLLIPTGSVMRGVVTAVQPATRTNRTSRMTLNFEQVTVNGRAYPMRGTLSRVISGPGIKGDATRVGAGAAVGAVIGGILGGAKGAIAGLLVGGGGVLAATEGKEVDVPAGTVLRVRVDSPIQIQVQ